MEVMPVVIFPVVREGYVFILAALVLGTILGLAVHPYLAVPFVVIAFYYAYIFRNPKRKIPADPLAIVSPADGTVQEVVSLEDDDFLKQRCKKVVIFLSVFDVHVNRSPIEGEIKIQKYVCGRFKPAYKDSVGFENERHMIGIENPRLRVTVTQIAGILARRIVSWVTLDDVLEKGELYGLIRFGSCTELVVPAEVEIFVKKGDKVVGGETVIGRLSETCTKA